MSRPWLTLPVWAWLLAGPARADDWPGFRGPTGQGIVLGKPVPVEWGPAKNLAWKQALPGKAWSSPAVVGGKVYLTNAVPVTVAGGKDDHSLRALCLDAATGKVLWDQQVFVQEGAGAPPIHPKNSHASPTPLVDGKQLFVHFGHQGTACLDLDGNVLWRNRDIRYEPVHGNGGSPVLVDGLLVFSCDGGDRQFVVALDRDTGKERWRTDRGLQPRKGFSFSTPLVISVQGRTQIVSPGSDMVAAYEPATGKEIWRVRYDGFSVVPRPIFGHGLVFMTTGYGVPNLLAIRPDGHGDVTATHVAWSLRRSIPHNPALLPAGDDLFFVADNGVASCVEARTGKVFWQERLGGKAFSASPILSDGKVYFLSEDGLGIVIKAARTFEVLARNPLNERTLASYAAADGALFLRTESHLYCFKALAKRGP